MKSQLPKTSSETSQEVHAVFFCDKCPGLSCPPCKGGWRLQKKGKQDYLKHYKSENFKDVESEDLLSGVPV